MRGHQILRSSSIVVPTLDPPSPRPLMHPPPRVGIVVVGGTDRAYDGSGESFLGIAREPDRGADDW